jgi:hypothetical protein
VLVGRRAGELDSNLVQGRVRRDRHLRVAGHGADARLELGICRGGLQRLVAFPVGDIDQLEPGLRRESAVQPVGCEMRSCSSPVLMYQAAEQVTPTHPVRAGLIDGDQLSG